ncbi:hypothetical protein POPTR_013G083700v4 [Populus trichocarpa]|uniref:Sororin C-terminal region domain-containing protein n=1 Tax=Populus trichocarpa TaxID=3694 RepID=A0A2K1Y2Z0_POPTR|nr:hypothetical protein BDE02_13G078300 [Populus trichocarpa]PNT07398.1 hypothetical protein POPTR_013G083700v4 [Populus trichocarpa]|eukprot:XP_024439075.1 nuclear receptor subfamily 4 group A member 1 [Populus trichocarpa]
MEAENIRINNNNNNKKRSSRKPLADCTNLSPSSSTSSTNNIPSSSSFKKPSILSFSLNKFPNTKNKPGSTPSHKTPASKSAAVSPPTPSHPPESSPLPGSFGDEIFEPHSVYTRRQSTEGKRKSKGRASFTPAPKTEFASYKMNDVGVTHPSKSLAVHRKKRRCGALSDGDEKKHALPQDYIEQQRAYFAEIDAFELSEEEVGSSNELD